MYRKKDDDSLVILKEINMHDLTAQERHLATNEVQDDHQVYIHIILLLQTKLQK